MEVKTRSEILHPRFLDRGIPSRRWLYTTSKSTERRTRDPMPQLHAVLVYSRHCECIWFRAWNQAAEVRESSVPNGQHAEVVSSYYPAGIPRKRARKTNVVALSKGSIASQGVDVVPSSLDYTKLVYGVIFSLRNMANKLVVPARINDPIVTSVAGMEHSITEDSSIPPAVEPSGPGGISLGQGFHTFATGEYKLHILQTASRLRIVVMTSIDAGDMARELDFFYSSIYVQNVVLNPLYDPDRHVRIYDSDTALKTAVEYSRNVENSNENSKPARTQDGLKIVPPMPLLEARGLITIPAFDAKAQKFFEGLPQFSS